MPRFIVIPRDIDSEVAEMSPSVMQAIVERYAAWTARLAQEGRLVVGEKLRDGEGRVLRGGTRGLSVTDGPFVETKEIVGGFWIIEADDMDDAVAAVSDCPHLDSEGSLEIREIEVLS